MSTRFRFKLRTSLYALAAAAVVAAYVGTVARHGHRHSANVQVLANAGGLVGYDYDPNGYQPKVGAQDSYVRSKLRAMFGDKYFGTVKQIALINPTPGSPLADSTIDELQAFPYTTNLILTDYEVSVGAVKELARSTQLRSVVFFRCILNHKAISSLVLLDNVESLGLSDPSLNDQILEQVCSSTKVQELQLYSLNLDSKCLKRLKLLPSLNSLSIWGFRISDNDLKWLAENLQLETLKMREIEGFTIKGLVGLGAMPELKSLIVLGCDGIQDYVGTFEQLPHN